MKKASKKWQNFGWENDKQEKCHEDSDKRERNRVTRDMRELER